MLAAPCRGVFLNPSSRTVSPPPPALKNLDLVGQMLDIFGPQQPVWGANIRKNAHVAIKHPDVEDHVFEKEHKDDPEHLQYGRVRMPQQACRSRHAWLWGRGKRVLQSVVAANYIFGMIWR